MSNAPTHPRFARRATTPVQRLGLALSLAFVCALPPGCSDSSEGKNDPAPSAADTQAVNAELGRLQKEFQTVLQEKLDLARFEAKARAFAQDHPDQVDAQVLVAQIRMAMHKWSGAYGAWLLALEQQPRAYELCKMAGFCAAKLGQYPQALAHYQDAANAAGQSTHSDVYAALGRLHLTLGDLAAAQDMFNKALVAPAQGDQTNWKHEAYSGLANVAAARGETEKAFELVDQAIQLAKIDSQADVAGYHIQKARIYMDADRDAQAVTMLAHTWQAYEPSRWRIESARLRARLYDRAGALDKAVNHVTLVCQTYQLKADRKDLEMADLYALLAQWQIKAGQADAAETSLHNLATLMPMHPRLAELRGQLQLQ